MENEDIDIKKYCADIDEWPESWKGVQEDIEYGKEILIEIKRFIKHLISKNYKQKTIKRHIDNLWLLGGEIIDRINRDKQLKEIPPLDLLAKNIGPDGGPYSRHITSEYELDSFDATCRKFYKFRKLNI